MLKDITLGQYFPGTSIAHKLDPRTKILLVTLYIIALFSAKGLVGYLVMAATLAACVKVSHVGLKSLVRGLKPLVVIIVFTGVLNICFTPAESYLFTWGIIRVSVKGIQTAVFMVVRIMLLVMGTFLMTYTTSPIRLTDGLESPAESPEKGACAGPRAGHDDVHCPAVHPHPDRGDGQDHVCSEGPGRRL